MNKLSKRIIRKAFNLLGLDMIKISNSPARTFLGLKTLPIKTIIDVGANAGQFGRFASRAFRYSRLYCFEPLPGVFKELDRWAKTQNGRVKTFNLAIGEREGNTDLYDHLEHSPSSSLLKSTVECESYYPFTKKHALIPVKLATLDKAVANENLMPDILIKLDVQGYEDRVIKGGTETFRKAKVCILEVSLEQLYENQATFRDVLILLSDLGFRYVGNLEQTYADDGHVIYIDSVFTK